MRTRGWPVFLLALLLPAAGSSAKDRRKAEASFSVTVASSEWRALRLEDLPEATRVAVAVRTSGALDILLLDEAAYRTFPGSEAEVLFRSRAERKLSFSVTTQDDGDHYVVLDNRRGRTDRDVSLEVAARRLRQGSDRPEASRAGPIPGDPAPELDRGLARTEAKLRTLQEQLRRIFVFEPMEIRARECGSPDAYTEDGRVTLCREYAARVYGTLGDREKASDTLLFTLFHELGHVLLEQWDYPFAENEDIADEFATAMMLMLGQGERLASTIEYFVRSLSLDEAFAKTLKDDRHSLSVQRARNIVRWVKEPEVFLRGWQPVFVPHMQSDALETVRRNEPAWADLPLVERELAERRLEGEGGNEEG